MWLNLPHVPPTAGSGITCEVGMPTIWVLLSVNLTHRHSPFPGSGCILGQELGESATCLRSSPFAACRV